jgi:hypothetical protein
MVFLPPRTRAVSTRAFVLDDVESFSAGELNGTAASSDGTVSLGIATRRHGLAGVASAYCLARAADQSVFFGTGNNGKIYRLRGGEVTVFAETGQLLVTSLVFDGSGRLFAGTLPRGKIFTVTPKGTVQEFSKLDGVEHIWALAYDAKRKLLFAATGPQGKLFAIDAKGKADLYYDADTAHLMSLVLDSSGATYVGTSDRALVLKVLGPKRATVVQDLPGTEVTALAVRDGQLAAVANEFPSGSAGAAASSVTAAPSSSSAKPSASPSSPETPSTSSPKSTAAGTGQLWLIGPDGRAESIFKSEKAHLTAVQWADAGSLYAGAGREGRVYRVHTDGTYEVWIDVDERMVLALDLTGERPVFSTGDTAAVYETVAARGDQAVWTSKVLDAQYHARWGMLSWRARGPVSFQTRSGNAEKTDATWSAWSAALTQPAITPSPAARYLQIRARFTPDPLARLYAVTAYYLPLNQRMKVRDIAVKARPQPVPRSQLIASCVKGSDKKAEAPSAAYELSWKVDNPDGDPLRYRLQFRGESQAMWRPMLRPNEVLVEEKYEWDTSSIPDGFYRVRVRASDELTNPRERAQSAEAESKPILVDNHAPEVRELAASGNVVHGVARDLPGPIAGLEYAVDGGEWVIFYPRDELFDSAEEPFAVSLDQFPSGPHLLAVRATDSMGNTGSAEITVMVSGTGKPPPAKARGNPLPSP